MQDLVVGLIYARVLFRGNVTTAKIWSFIGYFCKLIYLHMNVVKVKEKVLQRKSKTNTKKFSFDKKDQCIYILTLRELAKHISWVSETIFSKNWQNNRIQFSPW